MPILFAVLMTLLACASGRADSKQSQEYYMLGGTRITKVEAVIALAKDRGAGVVKCQPQELTEKATLRNKKK